MKIVFVVVITIFSVFSLSCTNKLKYPLSFGYTTVEECNSLGDTVTKYEYYVENKTLYKKATGLIQGKWSIEYGNKKDDYYVIKRKEIGKDEYDLEALVKYDGKGRVIEKVPYPLSESVGRYKYKYSKSGVLVGVIYTPRVPMDEKPVSINSEIEVSDKTLQIKYMYDNKQIKYIERYHN